MIVKDTTGRSMLVDLVYQNPQRGWLKASCFQLIGPGTVFCSVPHGQWALRIHSMNGADVIVFENGQKLVQTSVPARGQVVAHDANRNSFMFVAPGQQKPVVPATDIPVSLDNTATTATADGAEATEGKAPVVRCAPPAAPTGHGLVYAVVRFAKTNDPFGEPPQEELEIAFQMLEPDDFSEFFAQNFRRVKQAPKLPNPTDEFSREPLPKGQERTRVHCTFSGHKH